jgi:hypothetical protein
MFGPIDSTNAMLLIGALDDQAYHIQNGKGPKIKF